MRMVVKKGHHSAYETYYHIVFPVKHRKALLRREVVVELKQIAAGIEERYEIEFEQIGCDHDQENCGEENFGRMGIMLLPSVKGAIGTLLRGM